MRARAANLSWPVPEHFTDSDLEGLLFATKNSSQSRKPLPVYVEIFERLKQKGATLSLEWERYKQTYPDGYQYSQFCDLYRQWVRTLDVVMRQEHKAGEKLFSDFAGTKLEVIDRFTGVVRDVHLFVCALGASGYTYAEAFWSENSEAWCLGHAHAFEDHYGGSVEIIVPDNPRAVVTKPCRYEPDIHLDFQNMAAHFGSAVIPARVRHPKDKGIVEAAVKLATRWIIHVLRDQQFFSLAELNFAIRKLLEKLNNRAFRRLPGETRHSLFEKLEKSTLKSLPNNRYEYVQIGYVNVSNLDYHVKIDSHFYSVPYTLVKKKIEYRLVNNVVEILHNNKRIASHARAFSPGYTTDRAHMPLSHQAYLDWSPERVLESAEQIGPHTRSLVERIMTEHEIPQQAFRSCLGIVRLARSCGAARLEAATERALTANALSLKAVRLILENGMDRRPTENQPVLRALVHHENIRGPQYYDESLTGEQKNDDEHNTRQAAHVEALGNGGGADVSVANA